MTDPTKQDAFARIAAALERLAPPPRPPVDLAAHAAYRWDGHGLEPIADFDPPDYALLTGIDARYRQVGERRRLRGQGAD
jgi:predicted AAA+ superfamily ATPase